MLWYTSDILYILIKHIMYLIIIINQNLILCDHENNKTEFLLVGEITAVSYELICFHTSIIRPLARRYVMVGSLSFLSRSSYGIPLPLSTILVALIWTFSIAYNCLLLIKPPQTETPNSRCWRSNALFIQWNNNICHATGEAPPYEARHLVCLPQFCFYV